MKLEKFDNKNKKKSFIFGGITLVLITLVGIVIYRSYALYQEEKSFNVLQGKIGEFGRSDIQLAFTIDGKKSTSAFPTKSDGYVASSVTCENGVSASWDNGTWGLAYVNSNGNAEIKCSIDFMKARLCRRATTLHTETCSNTTPSYYCSGDGYSNGSTITYGNLGTSGKLTTGDAFDCDVNGDGNYDAITERFYYVTDMDSNTAVMIYYNNVSGGVANNTAGFAYDSSGSAINGPITARSQLPKTTKWSNVSLTNKTRNITTETGTTVKSSFSYSGYAARLLTYQEVNAGCYDGTTAITKSGGLSSKCKFLYENTSYSSSSLLYGYWLETPHDSRSAWDVDGSNRRVRDYVNDASDYGVRPAIEVLKSDISY